MFRSLDMSLEHRGRVLGHPVVDRGGEVVFSDQGFANHVAVDKGGGWVVGGIVEVDGFVLGDLEDSGRGRRSDGGEDVGERDGGGRRRRRVEEGIGVFGEEGGYSREDQWLDIVVFVVNKSVEVVGIAGLCSEREVLGGSLLFSGGISEENGAMVRTCSHHKKAAAQDEGKT